MESTPTLRCWASPDGEHTNVTLSPWVAGTSAVGVAKRNARDAPDGDCTTISWTAAVGGVFQTRRRRRAARRMLCCELSAWDSTLVTSPLKSSNS